MLAGVSAASSLHADCTPLHARAGGAASSSNTQQALRKRLFDVAAGLLHTGLTGLTERGGARPTNAKWTMVAKHAHIY